MKAHSDSEQLPSPEAEDLGCAGACLAVSPSVIAFHPSLSHHPLSGWASGPGATRRGDPAPPPAPGATLPSRPRCGRRGGPGSGVGRAGRAGAQLLRRAPPHGAPRSPGAPRAPAVGARAWVSPHLPPVPGMRPNPALRPKPRRPSITTCLGERRRTG